MADDFEEQLDIEKLGKHQTSTPRTKYNKHTEKTERIENTKKKRKESIEKQPEEVEKGDQNVKKRIKDLAGSEEVKTCVELFKQSKHFDVDRSYIYCLSYCTFTFEGCISVLPFTEC